MSERSVEADRDLLAQVMWDVRALYGFDTDGDCSYGGTNFPYYAKMFLADMLEARADLWDEGYEAGRSRAYADERGFEFDSTNPYREAGCHDRP